jgi:hypothetical protein
VSRRRTGRGIRLPLTTEQAPLLADTLEAILGAIYARHGDAIADLKACLGIETPMPPDAVLSGDPDAPDGIDF